jgi:hypothetical protein
MRKERGVLLAAVTTLPVTARLRSVPHTVARVAASYGSARRGKRNSNRLTASAHQLAQLLNEVAEIPQAIPAGGTIRWIA